MNHKPTETVDYSSAFEIAKQVLRYIGEYRTPAVPQNYEVWYRHVEGENAALSDRIGFLTNQIGVVSANDLESLRQQFLDPQSNVVEEIASELAAELIGLRDVIGGQLNATDGFSQSVDDADNSLQSESLKDIKAVIGELRSITAGMKKQLSETRTQLESSKNHVTDLNSELVKLREATLTDPLTGLGNRRYLDISLNEAIKELEHTPAFLLMIDLDSFKSINDSFGHVVGDQVISHAAAEIKRAADGGIVARFGGDEFCVILRVETLIEAQTVAERIREDLAVSRVPTGDPAEDVCEISASIGVARLRADDQVESWLERADKLTYSAKAAGKDFVMVERQLQE